MTFLRICAFMGPAMVLFWIETQTIEDEFWFQVVGVVTIGGGIVAYAWFEKESRD
jgi:hypothetical protein